MRIFVRQQDKGIDRASGGVSILGSTVRSAVVATGLTLVAHGLVQAQAGAEQLTGVVEDSLGRGVLHAQIQVRGTALVALTDSSGRFVLTGVGTGSHQLEVRALGYYGATQTVVQRAGRIAHTRIVLRAWPCVELECEGVQVVPSAPDTSGD
jgi:Carboxypeptidase regulatory-like domain